MNWLDWMIIAMLGASVVGGFREGFVRMGIGMAALIVGFFAASWFHGTVSDPLSAYVHSKAAATALGFVIIFVGVLIVGAMVASILVRLLKIVGLSPVDRVLGAGFGFVRGVLVLAVAAMILMAFAPKRLPGAMNQSELAPYVIAASRMISAATPYELKNGVERTYAEMEEVVAELKTKKKKNKE